VSAKLSPITVSSSRSADGQRFLMVKETPQASDIKINVVANWFEELKRLVPVH